MQEAEKKITLKKNKWYLNKFLKIFIVSLNSLIHLIIFLMHDKNQLEETLCLYWIKDRPAAVQNEKWN